MGSPALGFWSEFRSTLGSEAGSGAGSRARSEAGSVRVPKRIPEHVLEQERRKQSNLLAWSPLRLEASRLRVATTYLYGVLQEVLKHQNLAQQPDCMHFVRP